MKTRLVTDKIWRLRATGLLLGLSALLVNCQKSGDSDSAIDPDSTGVSVTPPQAVTASGTLTDIVQRTSHLSLLNMALTRAGLTDKLKTGSLTLFAPNDAAFRAAGYSSKASLDSLATADLQRLLQYHVLDSRLSASALPVNVPTSVQTALVTATVSLFKAADGKLYANAGRVVQPDIGADKSVMYVIDRLLTVPTQTTVEVIRTTTNLSMFRLAVERVGAGITNTLLSPTDRGITVFAPSNKAFQEAGFANEDAILAADINRLTEILRYHVVTSRAFSPTLRSGDVSTAQGTPITVAINAKGTTVTGKGNPTVAGIVLKTDLITTNGVVHIIDRVLLPTPVAQ